MQAGILDPTAPVFVRHVRVKAAIDSDMIETVGSQIDAIVAIGDLYKRDRFAAPASVWSDLAAAMPELVDATEPAQ